jgi:DNA-binding CsgD family transcriptional regulator
VFVDIAVDPVRRRSPRVAVGGDLSAVVEAVERVRRVLAPASMPAIEQITDSRSAISAVNTAWVRLERALKRDATASGLTATSEDLLELTRLLRCAERSVQHLQGDRFGEQLAAVGEVLGRFGGIQSVPQLLRECPRAVTRLGFDRAMYSLVYEREWTPQAAYSVRRPEAARRLVLSAQKSPQTLTSAAPEFGLLRRDHSILVADVRDNPNVHREIATASGCRSYVATRVVANGNVVGLIHADKYLYGDGVDECDRHLLGLFGEAFGYVLARAMLLEQNNAVQVHLSSLATAVTQAAAGLRRSEGDVGGHASSALHRVDVPETAGPTGLSLSRYGLTNRETEILQLMASGLDNTEIASRLYLAVGTVKSHVKHILRKLGATNRAQAISLWFNACETDDSHRPWAPPTALGLRAQASRLGPCGPRNAASGE